MYLINPYVFILLALIMTSQYLCAVLVLCQSAWRHPRSCGGHVCKRSIRNSRRCTFITRPYQAIQLIAVRSGGGTIPLFPVLDTSSVNSFSVALLYFERG